MIVGRGRSDLSIRAAVVAETLSANRIRNAVSTGVRGLPPIKKPFGAMSKVLQRRESQEKQVGDIGACVGPLLATKGELEAPPFPPLEEENGPRWELPPSPPKNEMDDDAEMHNRVKNSHCTR